MNLKNTKENHLQVSMTEMSTRKCHDIILHVHCGLHRVMRIYKRRHLDSVRYKPIVHNTDRIVGLENVTFK